jgi:sensor histidine kinase YesM
MKSNSQPRFKLSLRVSGFPFRLFIVSTLSIGSTVIVGYRPNSLAIAIVFVCVVLIIALVFLLYPILSKLSLRRGLALAWYTSLMVPGITFLMLPLIEPLLSEIVPGPIDRNSIQVFLWILGLFVLPIVLVREQLVFAQSEVEILEKEHEVSDLDFRIRPHFFFNSLNSVASLIVVDPLRAEEGLLDLADMFRIIMTDKRKLVPFSAEYEMAYKYMTLEKMRLGDRLQDEWKIGDIDETILLPILTLQPLIENAIYHGIETRLTGGKVTIKARQGHNNLYITIVNPKPEVGKSVRKGNLIARENLENRFRYLYKGDASISYVETDSFYMVTIKVPANLTLH